MSRAVRRQQQAAAPKEGRTKAPPRRLGAPQRPTRGAKPSTERRRLLRTPRWMEDIVAELKKVAWPSREETIYLSWVVVVVSLTAGIFLGGIDIFFNWLIE